MKARNRIKPLLTLCCALLLVAAGVFGTLAGAELLKHLLLMKNVETEQLS